VRREISECKQYKAAWDGHFRSDTLNVVRIARIRSLRVPRNQEGASGVRERRKRRSGGASAGEGTSQAPRSCVARQESHVSSREVIFLFWGGEIEKFTRRLWGVCDRPWVGGGGGEMRSDFGYGTDTKRFKYGVRGTTRTGFRSTMKK
jgi:hypothetical protein